MQNGTIHILWDTSHLWGLMAWRAILATGIDCRLVKSEKIAQGRGLGKHDLLLVPGGSARQKAMALGGKGLNAIRAWVKAGGAYLGFCGGAGLALRPGRGSQGLGLCPWQRSGYSNRLYHMLSGNVFAINAQNTQIKLPIWWPGRFAPEPGGNVAVLAKYLSPSPDLWLADLPLARVPRRVLAQWEEKCNMNPCADFPAGQPLVIAGAYGQGRYVLSYAHLETPDSPGANAMLLEVIEDLCGLKPRGSGCIPPWQTGYLPQASLSGRVTCNDLENCLAGMLAKLAAILELGEDLQLFFRRAPWLWGWRYGMPGMAFNNLLAALSTACLLEPTDEAQKLWREKGPAFCLQMRLLFRKMEAFLWDARMEKTLRNAGQIIDNQDLRRKSEQIFGLPMPGGGLIEEPLQFMEELLWLGRPRD